LGFECIMGFRQLLNLLVPWNQRFARPEAARGRVQPRQAGDNLYKDQKRIRTVPTVEVFARSRQPRTRPKAFQQIIVGNRKITGPDLVHLCAQRPGPEPDSMEIERFDHPLACGQGLIGRPSAGDGQD
jgi:hypothetical protein